MRRRAAARLLRTTRARRTRGATGGRCGARRRRRGTRPDAAGAVHMYPHGRCGRARRPRPAPRRRQTPPKGRRRLARRAGGQALRSAAPARPPDARACRRTLVNASRGTNWLCWGGGRARMPLAAGCRAPRCRTRQHADARRALPKRPSTAPARRARTPPSSLATPAPRRPRTARFRAQPGACGAARRAKREGVAPAPAWRLKSRGGIRLTPVAARALDPGEPSHSNHKASTYCRSQPDTIVAQLLFYHGQSSARRLSRPTRGTARCSDRWTAPR